MTKKHNGLCWQHGGYKKYYKIKKNKILKLLNLFFFFFMPTILSPQRPCQSYYSFNKLEDGWYKATVEYFNYRTYTRSTYTLRVAVENDAVTKIDFGNGGSVHTGYNNSGYRFTGGFLSFRKNYTGQIESASSLITIYYDN